MASSERRRGAQAQSMGLRRRRAAARSMLLAWTLVAMLLARAATASAEDVPVADAVKIGADAAAAADGGGGGGGEAAGNGGRTGACEMLSSRLTFTQDKAPRDISAVMVVVGEKLRTALNRVVDVRVEYTGQDIHSVVGHHDIKTKVVTEEAEGETESCFLVGFDVLDVDECALPDGHPMHHRCHPTAACRNTNGSYVCECAGESYAVLSASGGKCASEKDTSSCCVPAAATTEKLFAQCMSGFRCQTERCPGDCTAEADCVDKRGFYECTCPEGQVGTGHTCGAKEQPVAFVSPSGKLVTDHADTFCGCQKPRVDHCLDAKCPAHSHCVLLEDDYECACDPGFEFSEEHGCVDETPPQLRVRGPNPLTIKQCSVYEELAVDVIDDNAEDYGRQLRITYSQPLGGCVTKLGRFYVNYTVATPWTQPPFVRETRTVIVEDVDECALAVNDDAMDVAASCDGCVPHCAPSATCVNTPGSYTCRCPTGTTGDGFVPHSFLPNRKPQDYNGGTGCTDSLPPVITLRGANPKVFTVCTCSGALCDSQRRTEQDYDRELRKLMRWNGPDFICQAEDTVGPAASSLSALSNGDGGANAEIDVDGETADLSGSPDTAASGATGSSRSSNTGISRQSCYQALDHTLDGIVDVSSRVVVGEPIKVNGVANRWMVPYDVSDRNGNAAKTVYRDIIIKEVSLDQARDEGRNSVAASAGHRAPPRAEDCDTRACAAHLDRQQREFQQVLEEERMRTAAAAAAAADAQHHGGQQQQCDCPPPSEPQCRQYCSSACALGELSSLDCERCASECAGQMCPPCTGRDAAAGDSPLNSLAQAFEQHQGMLNVVFQVVAVVLVVILCVYVFFAASQKLGGLASAGRPEASDNTGHLHHYRPVERTPRTDRSTPRMQIGVTPLRSPALNQAASGHFSPGGRGL